MTGKPSKSERLFNDDAKFRALIENSTDGLLLLSRIGELVYVSPSALRMFGYSKDESLGRSAFTFIHPEDRKSVIKAFGKLLLKPSGVISVAFRVRHKSGNFSWIEATGQNQIADSTLKSIVVNFRDITEKKVSSERDQFLNKVKSTLSRSLEESPTLQELVNMSVPFLADYCRMVLVNDVGEVRHSLVSETSVKGGKRIITKLYEQYRSDENSNYGVPHILKTGKSEIIADVSEALSQVKKKNKGVVSTVKQIGLRSYMGVPLIARGKVLGVITFSSAREALVYTVRDLAFAEEIAHYIALSIDNFRMFREAQEEIEVRRDIEERLELAQKVGNIGVFEVDILQGKFFWSDELKQMYGLRPEQQIKNSKEWDAMIHPEDRKIVANQYKADIKTTDYVEYEFRIILPNGEIKWMYAKIKIFFDKNRNPTRLLGVNIDVTPLKRSEQNVRFLAEASKMLASSLDYEETLNNVAKLAVPEIADWCAVDILEKDEINRVAIAHKDPKKVKWAWKLWKKDPPKLSQPGGVQNVLLTGKSGFYPLITQAMIDASPTDEKNRAMIKSLGLTSAIMVPLSVEGKVIGVLEFVTTESRKQFTKSDLTMAEELASRASLAVQNAVLYQQAQRAVALRDDFMSVASHELKTPITSLKIFTQILRDHLVREGGDAKALVHIAKMDNQINKMVTLIYDLLDISRIQSGQMDFNLRKVSLDDLIKTVIDDLQPGIRSHKIILNGQSGSFIFADEDRIVQVVANLISNAVKYSPDADRVLVTVKKKKKNGVRISIRDFGIGISRNDQKKVFERFFRGGSGGNTFPGLGIGLYVSEQIVRRHNGKLWVESEEGKGSVFHFDLPLREAAASRAQKESKAQSPHTHQNAKVSTAGL